MIIHLEQLSLAALNDLPSPAATGRTFYAYLSLAPGWGFTRPPCLHDAGELLPHHFNLTRHYRSVTFLWLPTARRYQHPHGPGLSSWLLYHGSSIAHFRIWQLPIHWREYILDTFYPQLKLFNLLIIILIKFTAKLKWYAIYPCIWIQYRYYFWIK